MVSIRRQRLIKLYGGSPPLDFIPSIENGQSQSGIQNSRHVTVLLTTSLAVHRSAEDKTKSDEPESSNVNESSSSNKQPIQHPVFKRRKRHRRKHFENQEPCIMRGVYYKNMKWQAAIKVDKKQIHLGTVGSQEEAASLYDRAAFMCGREPNFELTEEQKEELSKLSWDDFLTMTRSAINSKKHQRRISSRMKFEHPSQDNSDIKAELDVDQGGNSLSGSETSDS
ncbi:ethylene-responsive transcription factor-like protein At4g13040 isoform X2 [Bidens hawaiensis]|uniref:ethylene-responsive transcription factor-like protein At4g13040 isoform X2 n=1 Tax=Bidens hawaiensis TaxID=980011 RepID=UPI004049515B